MVAIVPSQPSTYPARFENSSSPPGEVSESTSRYQVRRFLRRLAQNPLDLSGHPTVKPVALVADAILDCSKRGGVVLDAFAGSGTTLIAAEKTGRRGYGIELDPRYCDVIIRRVAAAAQIEAIHAETGKTFAEIEQERAAESIVSVRALPACIGPTGCDLLSTAGSVKEAGDRARNDGREVLGTGIVLAGAIGRLAP